MSDAAGPLVGKTAIVTGAGSGIGAAITRCFSERGARVAVLGRRREPLEALATELTSAGRVALAMPCDVTNRAEVESVVAVVEHDLGPVDILVNNAGYVSGGAFIDSGVDELENALAVDVVGSLSISQVVARRMVPRGRGVILFNGSVNAHGGNSGFLPLNASKAALISAMRTLAVELGPHGVRVNTVSPGWVDVPEKWIGTPVAVLEHLRNDFTRLPLRRMMTTDEVAAAFAFLASDDAAMITGHDLVVDGGLTASLHVHETLPKEKP